MRLWTRTVLALAIVWGACFVDQALGQVQLTRGTYMGKVVGVRGMNVLIKSNNGISVIASLSPERTIGGMRIGGMGQPNVEVTGTLRPDNLQKGMCVRFTATVQGQTRRTATEPVKELSVFTPEPTTRFGLLSEGLGAGGADADKPGEPQTYLVVGSITSVRSGTITVEFPGGTAKGSVKAKVADDAVVNFKSNKLYAPPGADVTVEGMQVQGGREPVNLLVTNLKIQLPPPPLPKSKIARPPEPKDGEEKSDPFASQDAGEAPEKAGEDAAEPGGTQKAKVPGKIIKVN